METDEDECEKKSPIRLALLDLGRAGGQMHCKEGLFQIAAVCDCMEERRHDFSGKYGCKVYGNYKTVYQDISSVTL